MIFLGYFEKMKNYNHIRIIAQGTKTDRDDLKAIATRLNDDNFAIAARLNDDDFTRIYKVIEATNKTEAMQQLSRIARED